MRGGADNRFLFFTNVPNIPTDLDGVDLCCFFQKNNIEIVRLELTNKTPGDWYGAWRNQFYVFDVLTYLANFSGTEENSYLILDSDCLIMSSLLPMFDAINKYKIITYNCGYGENHKINGITTCEMREIYKEFYNEDAHDLLYKGGEIIGIKGSIISKLLLEYKNLWQLNYERYLNKKTKLNEEAHFLSLLYYRFGYKESVANQYIKRMWTAVQCDNIEKQDSNLIIWHLPAEKKYGFKRLFDYFKDINCTCDEYLMYCRRLLNIPGKRMIRKMKRIFWKVKTKVRKE